MAMTGAERSQALRDRNEAAGIKTLEMKLTATERSWISEAQSIGSYDDHTELLLFLVKKYIESYKDER